MKSGACGDASKGCYFPDDTSGLNRLLSKGLVRKMILQMTADSSQSMNHGWYTLTSSGRGYVTFAINVNSPKSIVRYQRRQNIPLDQCTTLELVQHLTDNGWKDMQTRKPSSLKPYKQGDTKTWFRLPGKTISNEYLLALAKSEGLLKDHGDGPREICHCQSKAYYTAFLKGLNPLPRQPLAYYQELMRRMNSKRTASNELGADIDIGMDLDLEDISHSVIYHIAFCIIFFPH